MPSQKDKKQEKSAKTPRMSSTDEDILTVLIGGEMYGLEILDRLNIPERPDPISFGSLYPALNRLEKKGFVTWRWGEEQDGTGGARRKYYKITGLGSKALNDVREYRAILAARAIGQGQTAMGGI